MKTEKKNKYFPGLCLCGITLIFSILSCVVDRQPIGYEGTTVGFASLNGAFHNAFGYNGTMDTISDIVMYFSFLVVACFAVYGVRLLIKEKSIAKVSKVILGLGILYVVVAVLYVAFKKIPINFRPILQPGETELETSFPSTHTLVIASVLGSAVVAVRKLFSNKNMVKAVTVIFAILIVVGVAARLFAGVHWMTDIVAGLLFSASLISLYAAWGLN